MADSNAIPVATMAMGGQKTVVVPTALHSLLITVKEIEKLSTYSEVLEGLKLYILKKRLYDSSNPCNINCTNDELASVFGISEFTLLDIKNLLIKVLFPVSLKDCNSACEALCPTISSLADTSKRKLDEKDEETPKKMCVSNQPQSPMYLFVPSPVKYESSPESNYSFQGYETQSAKDTSDEIWGFDDENEENLIAITEMYNLEFEPLSPSDDDNFLSNNDDSDSDSDIDMDILNAAVLTFVCRTTDSDMEYYADSEDDRGGSETDIGFDAEISESDKWKCVKCGILNKPPMRFCLKCFNERIGWLPDGSERRLRPNHPPRRRQRHLRNKNKFEFKNSKLDLGKDSPEPTCSMQEIVPVMDSSTELSTQGSISLTQSSGETEQEKLCYLCCEKPMNATIVHGRVGHQLSCYPCARKLQKCNKPCPICRRTIDLVVHQITF